MRIKILTMIGLLIVLTSGCSAETVESFPTNTLRPTLPVIERKTQPAENKAPTNSLTQEKVAEKKIEKYSILLLGVEEDPYTPLTKSIRKSVEDAVSEINDNPAKQFAIELHYSNVKDSPEEIHATYIELVQTLKPIIVLMAAPIDEVLHSEINYFKIPVLYFGFGGNNLDSEGLQADYLFWLSPLPDEQFAFFLEQTWKNWEHIRPPGTLNEFRVGFLTWDRPPHMLGLTPRLDRFNKDKQFESIFQGEIAQKPSASATNFLIQSITFGINLIYTDTFNQGPMILLNDIYSLGLNDFFVIGGSIWSYEEANTEYLLASGSQESFYIPLPMKWWNEDDEPAIIRAKKIINDFNREESDKNAAYLIGLGAVDILDHVIRAAFSESNSKRISSFDIYRQLDGLEQYSVFDGLFEVDYSLGNRSLKMLRLWSISAEQVWQPIGGFERVPNLKTDKN